MSTATLRGIDTLSTRAPATGAGRLSTWFSSLASRISEGRERRARLYVNRYLATLDDATLIDLGHDPAEVRRRPQAPSAYMIV